MAKSLSAPSEYPGGDVRPEHRKLATEPSLEEETKSEVNKKLNAPGTRENSLSRRTKVRKPSEEAGRTTNATNQSQLISKSAAQASTVRSRQQLIQLQQQQPQYDPNQKFYMPIDKLNYLKLSRLQQQYLNSCACNDCELCNKQTRAIKCLQRELEMARCELRSLRHHLLLSNSSKQPLNCLAHEDPDFTAIPPPTRYASSVPNTPRAAHRFDTGYYDPQCQDCCFADVYQPTSIHNVSTPCGLEHLLPTVNTLNSSCSGCCLDEYADQAYEMRQASKKSYEQKTSSYVQTMPTAGIPFAAQEEQPPLVSSIRSRKSQASNKIDEADENLIGNQSNIQLEPQSRLNRKTRLAAMQTFTLDPDDLDDYSLSKLELNQSKPSDEPNNNCFNEAGPSSTILKTNIKTQNTNPLFNRSKTSKSLQRSLSRDQQFGSLNYSKSESFDETNFHQKRESREQEPAKKQPGPGNYETTC